MKTIKISLLFFLIGCSTTIEQIQSDTDILTYEELSRSFVSCSGYGSISTTGNFNGNLSFSFLSQNDSSFFQFQDFLGRKVLLMWLTPDSVDAWNILENKRYNYSLIKDFFPLLTVVEPIDITKFLWGHESVYHAEDFIILGGEMNELSITFEKSNNNENLINKANFQDGTNRQEVAIILKSRVHSDEYIDLDKIWNLMLI